MEVFKDFADAWSQRVRSPITGSVLISVLVINWKPFWYLFFAEKPVRQKFLYFDANTSIPSLLWAPLIVGILVAVALPWIKLLGAFSVRLPTKLLRQLEHDDSHRQKIYKMEMSAEEIQVQARLDAAAEQAQIEAAKRLEEARQVGGETLKDEIRESRSSDVDLDTEGLDLLASDLLVLAASESEGSVAVVEYETDDGYEEGIEVGDTYYRISSNRKMLAVRKALDELSKMKLFDSFKDKVTLEGYSYLDRIFKDPSDRFSSIERVQSYLSEP